MIRLGVVGCGDVAFRTYFPGLKPLLDSNEVQVAVCFDPVVERSERAAALFPGAKAATSLEEVVDFPGLDAALNLTPAPFHRDTTSALLDGELHVFSEKPLAATVKQGQELIAQAASVQKTLMCAPAILVTNRFRWLSGLIRDGEIGQPKLALGQIAGMGPAGWRDYTGDPRVFYGPGVGPMIDTGVYILHAMTGLLGPAKRVQAMGGIAIPNRKIFTDRYRGEEITVTTNDQMLIQLDFGDATFAQVVSSFATAGSRAPVFELHGTRGSLSIGLSTWYNTNGGTDILTIDPATGAGSGWETRTPPENSVFGDIVSAGVPHFVAVLRGDEQPVLTAAHALHVLEIMLKAMESASTGTSLELVTTF